MKLLQLKITALALTSLFFYSTASIAAFPGSIDTDGDGVPDSIELWLKVHGAAVDPLVSDTYTHSDTDLVPDLIETAIMNTDPDVDERTVASAISGFGLTDNTGELAGQWDFCVHTTLNDSNSNGRPDECESVYTAITYNGISVMHSSADVVKSFMPAFGYADTGTETYNSGTNAYSGTFTQTEADGTTTSIDLSAEFFSAAFAGAGKMSGSLVVTETPPGLDPIVIPLLFTAHRRSTNWDGTADPSGIYTFQTTEIDIDTHFPLQRDSVFNPQNNAVQVVLDGSTITVYDGGFVDGTFYLGALGASTFAFVEIDNQGLGTDYYSIEVLPIIMLAPPAGDNTGLLRSAYNSKSYNDVNNDQPLDSTGFPSGFIDGTITIGPGDDIFEDGGHDYARHHNPRAGMFTRNTTNGFQSLAFLNNVPLAASQISLSSTAPTFTTTDIVNEAGGQQMQDALTIRNRIKPESRDDGFVNLEVGISSNNTHDVSSLNLKSTLSFSLDNLFPSGTYTFSSAEAATFNDPNSTTSVSADYTKPALGDLLPVVNPEPMTRQINSGTIKALNPGKPLNRFVLGSAKSVASNGSPFDVTQALTLTWPAVSGADKYRVIVTCTSNCDKDASQFRQTTSATSLTIPVNTLDQFSSYRINLEAKDAFSVQRSLTTRYFVNDTEQDARLIDDTLTEGPNVTGWTDNGGFGISFESIHRPGNSEGSGIGSGVGFILMHGRCSAPEYSVVSALRRSIARKGYDTLSIRLPANVAAAENNCSSSTTSFAEFEAGAAYVVPEAVARVRTAMNQLQDQNPTINKVVLVGFSLGSRLAAAAAAASNHSNPTPLPIVGLALTGTRSGSTVTKLDTTSALGELTIPVFDLYMDGDSPAVATAASRIAAYAGNASDYTQSVINANDPWGLVDGSTTNITNPRHKFLGYEQALAVSVNTWIENTSLTTGSVKNDFDNDGDADILWRHAASGSNRLWLMNNDGTIQSNILLARVTDLDWKITGVAHFNNGNISDILWRNSSSGSNRLWLMNSDGTIQNNILIPRIADLDWKVAGVEDFDNDGEADILWRNAASGSNRLWLMNNDGTIQSNILLARVADLDWKITGVAHFDSGNIADILWRNSSSGSNRLWLMNSDGTIQNNILIPRIADTLWQTKD